MDDIIYGFEVEHGKPASDIFLKACEKLDVFPEEALVLEDSEAGIDKGQKQEDGNTVDFLWNTYGKCHTDNRKNQKQNS